MKRKKWSGQEEQSLLEKYSELQSSGTLSKMKTREKKFRPIADHINAAHHAADPAAFPFRWSWRDVSIKVQNMRHQYLCVKQKIRLSPNSPDFNWDDGDNHWQNFLAYKSVFGDIDLDSRPNSTATKRAQENGDDDSDNDDSDNGDLDESRALRRRMAAEERREEEEMEWMEGMVAMQLHHEKEAMRIQAEACHGQMQVLGAMARLVSQFFAGGSGGGGDMGGVLPSQVLDDLGHHPGGGDNGKPDSNSPSEFM